MIRPFQKIVSVFASSGVQHQLHPSDKCPECGTPRMRTTEQSDWACPNLDCPAQIRARIEHWCSPKAMDIPGGAPAFVAVLVGHGLVRDVADLYRLKAREIAALPGMNKDSAQKFFDAITASMKREGWRVLFGLNIPHVSATDAQALCGKFGSVDNVLAASAERLMRVEVASAAAARSIAHWSGDSVNRKLVKRLFKFGVNFNALPSQKETKGTKA